MLSYGTGKYDKSSLIFDPTLSYHCHLQTFVWVEIKIRRLSSPLFSVCALKKSIGIHEIYQRLLRRKAFYEEKTEVLTVGILLTCDRDLQENLS